MRVEFARTTAHTLKRADVVLHFDQAEGILEGGRLEGFGLFEHAGGELRVTMPAKTYTINGNPRAYAVLRGSPAFIAAIESAILCAWRDETRPARLARMEPREPASLAEERKRATIKARRTGRRVKLSNGGSIEPSGFEWAPDEPAQAKP